MAISLKLKTNLKSRKIITTLGQSKHAESCKKKKQWIYHHFNYAGQGINYTTLML